MISLKQHFKCCIEMFVDNIHSLLKLESIECLEDQDIS